LAVSESGDWSSFLKAEQLFYEVYGKKIEAAKTPEAKAALAREIFEYAKTETDGSLKSTALQMVRQLVIDARYGHLALELAKYQTNASTNSEEAHTADRKGDEVWNDSLSIRDRSTRFALQLDALESWFAAQSPPSILVSKWDERLKHFLSENPPPQRPIPSIVSALNRRTTVVINLQTNLVLNVNRGSKSPGAEIIAYPLPADTNAQWTIEVILRSVRLRNVNSQLYLVVEPSANSQWSWNVTQNIASENAAFHIIQSHPGRFLIVHVLTQLALQPESGNTSSRIIARPIEFSNPLQHWLITAR
ncbi:MAG: RICIN domain-containing protein, partial [Candidatus Methanomethylicaceae archaeon]